MGATGGSNSPLVPAGTASRLVTEPTGLIQLVDLTRLKTENFFRAFLRPVHEKNSPRADVEAIDR